jgi:uncharacterized protein (DUF1499 family)
MFASLIRAFTQNHVRLETQSDDPRFRPWIIAGTTAEQLGQQLQSWVESKPLWNVESKDSGANAWHLTRRTRWLGFVDDIHLQLIDEPAGCRVEAESRSRIGKGDLGQNRRNLLELRTSLKVV